MAKKPAYEELQQRVKELEKENQEHKKKYEELTRLRPEAAPVNELKESEQRMLETSALIECSQAILIHREFEQNFCPMNFHPFDWLKLFSNRFHWCLKVGLIFEFSNFQIWRLEVESKLRVVIKSESFDTSVRLILPLVNGSDLN